VLKTFDKERSQPASVVNYPNDYDWTRITEYKYFLDESSPHTTVCFEYPKAEGEPYYIVMSKENMERREHYMVDVAALERQADGSSSAGWPNTNTTTWTRSSLRRCIRQVQYERQNRHWDIQRFLRPYNGWCSHGDPSVRSVA